MSDKSSSFPDKLSGCYYENLHGSREDVRESWAERMRLRRERIASVEKEFKSDLFEFWGVSADPRASRALELAREFDCGDDSYGAIARRFAKLVTLFGPVQAKESP